MLYPQKGKENSLFNLVLAQCDLMLRKPLPAFECIMLFTRKISIWSPLDLAGKIKALCNLSQSILVKHMSYVAKFVAYRLHFLMTYVFLFFRNAPSLRVHTNSCLNGVLTN